jgi:thiamine biosynthesis lipoprotein
MSAAEPTVITGRAMGTTWTAKLVSAAKTPEPEVARVRIAQRLEDLEQIFSTYRENSTVSRFNASRAAGWEPVDARLVELIQRCAAISEMTGGAFDVTVAPLVRRWGFGPNGIPAQHPSDAEREEIRAHVGWRKVMVRVEPAALRKDDPEVELDVSSMAKGYAVDQMSALLQELGASNHLVQLAGDIRASGDGPGGEGWRVGIERPRAGEAAIGMVVRLAPGSALSSSGNYRNAIVRGGRRMGHIIDPRDGQPVDSSLELVSVMDPACATSSALATGLFVLGADAGLKLAEERELAACFFVREGGRVVRKASREFERRALP